MGMAHKQTDQVEEREQAYQQALSIWVQQKIRASEASTFDELGLLYNSIGRLEESAVFHRQAADVRSKLQDLNAEGRSRSNLANALIKLQRYDEARREL